MTRCLLVSACLVAIGCSSQAPVRPQQSLNPNAVRTRLIVVSPDGSTNDAAQELKAAALVGEYRVGDGLGFNLRLIFKDDATFECTWTGCLGESGRSSGEWFIGEGGLNLNVAKADGMLEKQQLNHLQIVSFQNHYLLLKTEDRGWFDKHGPDTLCCFHQEGARQSLDNERMRRIKASAKE